MPFDDGGIGVWFKMGAEQPTHTSVFWIGLIGGWIGSSGFKITVFTLATK